MPKGAFNIHEHHNIDTNIRALSFSISPTENFSWPDHCMLVGHAPYPKFKTKRFPKDIHLFTNHMNCGNLFGVIDSKGVIHAWSN
jgi:hypothetical protein